MTKSHECGCNSLSPGFFRVLAVGGTMASFATVLLAAGSGFLKFSSLFPPCLIVSTLSGCLPFGSDLLPSLCLVQILIQLSIQSR